MSGPLFGQADAPPTGFRSFLPTDEVSRRRSGVLLLVDRFVVSAANCLLFRQEAGPGDVLACLGPCSTGEELQFDSANNGGIGGQ